VLVVSPPAISERHALAERAVDRAISDRFAANDRFHRIDLGSASPLRDRPSVAHPVVGREDAAVFAQLLTREILRILNLPR
jgi:hypothetical protein